MTRTSTRCATSIKATTGISLGEAKRELVYGRVSRRLRALGLESFGQYRDLLESGDAAEMVEFWNAITTNLTAFFRESHHFAHLRDAVLRPRVKDPRCVAADPDLVLGVLDGRGTLLDRDDRLRCRY